VLKNSVESFDSAQDERWGFDIIEDFPFMLRFSKHCESFFSNLIGCDLNLVRARFHPTL
jgi:hypothetical protein